MFKYGFTRENKSYSEGGEIIYSFYQEDGSHIEVVNYHLEQSTHNTALKQAGLSNIHWHETTLSPEGKEEFGGDFWEEILKSQPVIGLSCTKSL